jgi:hypothetical protein
VEAIGRDGQWRSMPRPPRVIRSAGRPEALAVRFDVVVCDAVLIRLIPRTPAATRRGVSLAEVWIGNADKLPPGFAP